MHSPKTLLFPTKLQQFFRLAAHQPEKVLFVKIRCSEESKFSNHNTMEYHLSLYSMAFERL